MKNNIIKHLLLGAVLASGLAVAARQSDITIDVLQQVQPDEREQMMMAQAMFDRGCYGAANELYASFILAHPFSPLVPVARAGMADCLYARGDYQAALDAYDAVTVEQLTPYDAAGVAFREAVAAAACGDDDRAVKAYERAAKCPDYRSDAWYGLGVMAFDKGDYDTAAQYFGRVNTSRPPGNRVPFYLARIDFARGQWSKALKAARDLLKQRPDGLDINEMNRIAGESLVRLGKESEGIEYLRCYLADEAEPAPSALYLVAIDEYDNGLYDDARPRFESVAAGSDGALQQSAYLYLGQILMRRGDKEAAGLAFDKAVRLEADADITQKALYNYTIAQAEGAQVPFASSVKLYEDFLGRYPDGIYSQRIARRLAEGYLSEKDYQAVIKSVDRIAAPTPELLAARRQALYSLAWEAGEKGQLDQAEGYLRQYMASTSATPELDSEASLLLAQVLAAKGKPQEAQELYSRYISRGAKARNLPTAVYGMAYTCYDLAQTRRAEQEFRRALSLFNDPIVRADILTRLADIRFAADDFAGAAEGYQQAYQSYPSGGDHALLSRARMLGFNRQYDLKLKQLTELRSLFPSSPLMPDALLETAQAQISLGRNADAVESFRKVIDKYPATEACRNAYLQMAMTLLDMERQSEAIEAYRALIEQYPRSEEAAHAAGLLKNIYADRGEAAEYLAFIQSVDDAPRLDAGQAEELTYQSALKQYERDGNTAPLRSFIDTYPRSRHAAELLAIALQHASDEAQADTLAALAVADYPGTAAAELGLARQGETLYAAGDMPAALAKWQALAEATSDPERGIRARIGAARAARDMDSLDVALRYADAVIAASPSGAYADEARFIKAQVLDSRGDTDGAMQLWLTLAADNRSIYGAKSSVTAAQALFDAGDNDKALDLVKRLVQSGSPHHYWVARGFILLSDIYAKEGKTFEAREYLDALRNNYPGTESDIFMMIDSRLDR